MTERRRTWLKRLLILPPVAVGIAVLAFQLSGRSAPDQAAPQEIARPVRVITVEPTDVVPRALGYGHVEPGRVWQAVAQVGGQVVEMHPLLDRGQLIPAGETILRIDPSDYELAVAQIEADLESLNAELAQLDVEQANTETLVEIGERALELAESELQRARRLRANGNISQAAVDQAANAVLTQRERLQQQLNRLALIPAERRLLEARRAQYQARLADARLDLQRTEIRMPFDARIAEVNVEETEFVNIGQVLVVADGIAVAEVNAQVAIDRMRPLVEGEAMRRMAASATSFSGEITTSIGK